MGNIWYERVGTNPPNRGNKWLPMVSATQVECNSAQTQAI